MCRVVTVVSSDATFYHRNIPDPAIGRRSAQPALPTEGLLDWGANKIIYDWRERERERESRAILPPDYISASGHYLICLIINKDLWLSASSNISHIFVNENCEFVCEGSNYIGSMNTSTLLGILQNCNTVKYRHKTVEKN